MNKMYKKAFVIGIMTLPFTSFSQVSVLGNSGSSGNYIGWNAAQPFPLEIRHNANQPINFFTNNTPRMKLNGTTSYAVNSWNSSRDGFLLLGSNTGTLYSTGAFSLLHLNGPAGAQDLGHRPWMETGITFTDNQDI